MKITFIQTGGTIDKDYPHTTKGWAFEFGEPATNRILEKLNPSFEYKVITAFQKDSLEITEADREKLANLIKEQEGDKFIITHGTDTMPETAQVLSGLNGKTIVLTGSMTPARFEASDAEFNIGCAVGALQSRSPGVYIAMNGRVFPAGHVRKNREAGCFEWI